MANNIVIYMICCFTMFQTTVGMNGCCTVVTTGTVINVKCSGCRLQTVPDDIPTNTTELDLHNNSLTILLKDSFQYLHHLDNLTLSYNKLSKISFGAFDGLQNLTYLGLSNNLLDSSSFDLLAFKPLIRLTQLDLRQNKFHSKKTYPEHAISHLSKVETLQIDIFEGFHFGICFLNLTNLKQINFAVVLEQRISILNLTFLGLERTVISHLDLHFPIKKFEINALAPFQNLVSLKINSVRTMNIKDVFKTLYGLQNRNMEYLALIGNFIPNVHGVTLVKSDFLYLRTICVRRLDLMENSIDNINMGAIVSWSSRKCLEILNLSSNSLRTVAILSYLALLPSVTHVYGSYQTFRNSKKRSTVINAQETFILPHSLVYLNLSHLPMNGLLPNVTVHENNSLKVLDVSHPLWDPLCSYARIKGLVHLTQLYFSGFDCSNYNPKMFADMPNLSKLEVAQCNLGKALAKNSSLLFKGRYNLSVLDLSDNNIDLLSPTIFEDQQYSLKTLIIASNKLISLHAHILLELHALETLDVSFNRISTLTKSDIAILDGYRRKSSMFKVNLFGNPLVCSCEVLDFLDWVGTTNVLYKKGDISCITSNGSQIQVMTFLQSFDEFRESCAAPDWLIISLILMVVFVFTILLSRIVWKHSVKLRVWCRQPLEYEEFPFDVFITYCKEDAKWVTRTLIPWLEQENIEYCIDEKTFDLRLDLCDNILNSIDQSRKSVFVVSCNYFKNEWQTFTMKLTSVYSFRDGRENMNVIILLNDMGQREFPKLIRKNWDEINPILWPDEHSFDENKLNLARKTFWKKMLKRVKNKNRILDEKSCSESAI